MERTFRNAVVLGVVVAVIISIELIMVFSSPEPVAAATPVVRFPTDLYGKHEVEIREELAKAGLPVGGVSCQTLAQMASVGYEDYWKQTPEGGLLSAYALRGGEWKPFELFAPTAPINQVEIGTTVYLAFRAPCGLVATVVPTTPKPIQVFTSTADIKIPNNLWGQSESVVRKALVDSRIGLPVVFVDYQMRRRMTSEAHQKYWDDTQPGGLLSLTVWNGYQDVGIDLSQKDQKLTAGASQIKLGFKAKAAQNPALASTPKQIQIAAGSGGKIKVPTNLYNHSRNDVLAALSQAGFVVISIADQNRGHMKDAASEKLFDRTMRGGLLSAHYIDTNGRMQGVNLFAATALELPAGTQVLLAFRAP